MNPHRWHTLSLFYAGLISIVTYHYVVPASLITPVLPDELNEIYNATYHFVILCKKLVKTRLTAMDPL
jgi:hypothetical protein